jgi:hypothetical protein
MCIKTFPAVGSMEAQVDTVVSNLHHLPKIFVSKMH